MNRLFILSLYSMSPTLTNKNLCRFPIPFPVENSQILFLWEAHNTPQHLYRFLISFLVEIPEYFPQREAPTTPTKPLSLPDTLSGRKSLNSFLMGSPHPRQQNKKHQLPHPMPILPVEGNLRREFTVTVKRGKNVQKHNKVRRLRTPSGGAIFFGSLTPPTPPPRLRPKKTPRSCHS